MKISGKKLTEGFAVIKLPAIVLLVVAFAILFVWQRAYTLSLSREVARLQIELHDLRVKNSSMEHQISVLASPGRIESFAEQLCGLNYSRPQQRVYVTENKQVPRIDSRWRKSFMAVRKYIAQRWASITGKRRSLQTILESGNL